MPEIHPYYIAKASAFLEKAGAAEADPMPAAAWAEAQPKTTSDDTSPMRTGIMIDADGQIVAHTEGVRPGRSGQPGAWYTTDDSTPPGRAVDMTGLRAVHATYSDLCVGPAPRIDIVRGDLMGSTEVAAYFGVEAKSINVAMSKPEASPRIARLLPEPIGQVGRSWVWSRAAVEAVDPTG